MQVSIENTSSLGRRLTIEVPKELVKSEEKVQMQDFAKKARIDGFRAGKVPAGYIQKKYGTQIHQEAVTKLLQTTLSDALREKNLRPANRPNVEDLKSENDLIYTVTFEVFPDIEVADFSKVELERTVAVISDEDVESGVKKLQDQFATWDEVSDRAAKDGDKLTIDFVGYLNGEPFKNGSANDFALELGSNSFIDGFEKGLIGAKIGDERTLDLKFPDPYSSADLAGKEVQFKVTVKKIQEKTLAAVDADFADRIGIEDKDVEKIRPKIKENMVKYVEEIAKTRLREQALEKLYEVNPIDVPESLVQEQAHDLYLERFGKKDHDHVHDEHCDHAHEKDITAEQQQALDLDAKRRVAVGLLLSEIVSKNQMQLDEARVLAKLASMGMMYGANAEMMQKMYRESEQLRQNVQNTVLTEQAIDLIVANATIKDKESKFYDIVNAKTE